MASKHRKRQGAAIVVVTHRATILNIVDVLMVLRNGALEMIGPSAEVYDRLRASVQKPSTNIAENP
jgi:ABC-type protease/lipase transport system fused ATPase/permease subunit